MPIRSNIHSDMKHDCIKVSHIKNFQYLAPALRLDSWKGRKLNMKRLSDSQIVNS